MLPRRPESWLVDFVQRALAERDDDVVAYVTGVLLKNVKRTIQDRVHTSVVLAFAEARWSHEFGKHQDLADWILFTEGVLSKRTRNSIVIDIGRWSYDTCWRMLRGRWEVYGTLAEELPSIVSALRDELP